MNSNYVSVECFAATYMPPFAHLEVPKQSLTTDDLRKAKRALEKANVPCSPMIAYCDSNTAATLQKQQGNNPMRSNNEIKNYFADRAETVFYSMDKSLQKQFGLMDDSSPRTAADIVARIQSGKYVLPTKDADYGIGSITWRDPSVVKDTAGYEVAYKALKTQRTATIDQIMSDETKALGAVEAFEAWTYTAPVATTVAAA